MDIYFAIAEPNRRLILEELAMHGQLTATQIAEKFQITASAISQHLKILFEADLVKREKRAQSRLYSLNEAKIEEFERWAIQLKKNWEERLDNLEKFVENSD